MPIIGMTDSVRPGLPELGRLRKGAKKTRPDRPGEDLEYFRFTSDRPKIVEAFRLAYNEQPRNINVFLPYIKAEAEYDGEEANFSAWMEEWNASETLLHRCDGKKVIRWYDPVKRAYQAGGGKLCPYGSGEKERTKKKPGCIQVGRLAVVVPELIEAGFVGYVLVETHSKNDIVSILASLLQIEAECKRYGGPMMGVLCRLQRRDQEITTPGWNDDEKANGKRHKTTKSLLKLSPAPEWVRAVQLEAKNRATPQLRLPETVDMVDGITGEIFVPVDEELLADNGPDWELTPNQDEPAAEEPVPTGPGPLALAMAFVLDSGKKLGSVDDRGLTEMLEQITNLSNPNDKMLEAQRHIETLLLYMDEMQGEFEDEPTQEVAL